MAEPLKTMGIIYRTFLDRLLKKDRNSIPSGIADNIKAASRRRRNSYDRRTTKLESEATSKQGHFLSNVREMIAANLSASLIGIAGSAACETVLGSVAGSAVWVSAFLVRALNFRSVNGYRPSTSRRTSALAQNFNERALPISGSGPQFQVMQECVELTRDIGRAAVIGLDQTE